jgi:hypothetical protein
VFSPHCHLPQIADGLDYVVEAMANCVKKHDN